MTDHLADALFNLQWGAERTEQSVPFTPEECRALREYLTDLEARVPKVEGEVGS